jgi:hypothetical protein
MRSVTIVALILCLQFVSAGSAQDSNVVDLLGTWDDITPERKQDRVGLRHVMTRIPLTFDGTACTWGEPGGPAARQSLFIPVQAGTHRGLEFVTVNSGAFWKTHAIYKIEGDVLTIKEGALNQPRPTDFTPWEFNGRNSDAMALVQVYKRRAK